MKNESYKCVNFVVCQNLQNYVYTVMEKSFHLFTLPRNQLVQAVGQEYL